MIGIDGAQLVVSKSREELVSVRLIDVLHVAPFGNVQVTAQCMRALFDRGITIAGDGMGGRKGGQHWAIGDDDDQQTRSEEVPGKKQGAAQQSSGNFWDF